VPIIRGLRRSLTRQQGARLTGTRVRLSHWRRRGVGDETVGVRSGRIQLVRADQLSSRRSLDVMRGRSSRATGSSPFGGRRASATSALRSRRLSCVRGARTATGRCAMHSASGSWRRQCRRATPCICARGSRSRDASRDDPAPRRSASASCRPIVSLTSGGLRALACLLTAGDEPRPLEMRSDQ
jgi:hypothetical protein